MSRTILVVDDSGLARRGTRRILEGAGYTILEAEDGMGALERYFVDKPDLVLLDLGLPDRDGLELIPLIKSANAAIIVVSARDATDQKVAALDLGADDYISKPFDTEEVLARIRVALRHRLTGEVEASIVHSGRIEIDLSSRMVRRDGLEVHLTPREYGFLSELAKTPGRVVTHAQLLKAVWGPGHETDVEYLRVAARSIRRKLEDDPGRPALFRNEPGIGYRLLIDS